MADKADKIEKAPKPELTPEERLTKDLKTIAAKARSINNAIKDFGETKNLHRLTLKVELGYDELSDAVKAFSVTLKALAGK